MIKTLFKNSDDKNSDDYLIAHCDTAIAELVFDKVSLVKAFNYYHGVRDRFQFAHLEHNYGIGNPTSIEFIPLVRKHIDALVGEYLATNITPKISCKDKGTLTNMFRDKQLAISGNIAKLIKTHLTNSMFSALKQWILILRNNYKKFLIQQIEILFQNMRLPLKILFNI